MGGLDCKNYIDFNAKWEQLRIDNLKDISEFPELTLK
jgi:hypothetical protein